MSQYVYIVTINNARFYREHERRRGKKLERAQEITSDFYDGAGATITQDCYRHDQCPRYLYTCIALSKGDTHVSLHLAMRGRGRGRAIFYQKPSARGGIELFSPGFFSTRCSCGDAIGLISGIESRAISSKCVWIAMDARIEPASFAQMEDF